MNKNIGKELKYAITLIFVFIFIFMLYLNFKTTFVADDFNNMFFHNQRITSINQIIQSQIYRYYNTNGRVFAHFMGGVLLMNQKFLINILNSGCFCIFMYLIYSFIYLDNGYILPSRRKRGKAILGGYLKNNIYKMGILLFIFFSLWNYTPFFGQDFLWVIGSANYMWTTVFVLYAVLIARKIALYNVEIRSNLAFALYIFIFFLAGSTNENTVPGFIVIIMYYMYIMYKDKSDNLILMVLLFISSITGYVLMITSPGNFVRTKAFKESAKGAMKYLLRVEHMNDMFVKYFIVVFIVALLLGILARVLDMSKKIESSVFIFAGITSYYSMIMSPTFPERAMLITLVYFIIGCIINLSIIISKNWKIFIIIFAIMLGFLTYMFSLKLPSAIDSLEKYKKAYDDRAIHIWHNMSIGKLENIKVEKINTKSTYVPAYNLEQCEDNPKHWINVTIARYYGVKSITTKK